MAARQFQILLLVELAFYALVGAVLVSGRGWTPGEAAQLALVTFLGVRLAIVLITFGLSARYGSVTPEDAKIGIFGTVAMVAGEYLNFILLFAVVMPFQRLVMGDDRLGHCGARPLPLLLIHGYQCNRGFWFWIRNRLEAAGWTVATHNLEPVYTDIDRYAAGIARRVDEVRHATGAEKVILVGHSMGGLAARAYLRRYGCNRVARLVTLGSPHRGTLIAALGAGPNARQMRVGSHWLGDLADGERLPGRSVSILSHHDNYVFPQTQAGRLKGAIVSSVTGVGHLGMAVSRRTLAALREALEAD